MPDQSAHRLVIIGGSTAAGLGARGRSFATMVSEGIPGAVTLDLSETGRMLDEHLAFEPEIREFRPQLAVVCAGASESMVHPGPTAQRIIGRWAPASWHGVGGLQPRAFYSGPPMRRRRQKVSSAIKVAVKRPVIRTTKGRSRMSSEDFGRNLDALLDLFDSLDCRAVVVGLWRTDERLFPRTNAALGRAQLEVDRAVAGHPGAVAVPVDETLRYWDDFLDDRIHWNDGGHRRVADLVLTRIAAVGPTAETGSDQKVPVDLDAAGGE